MQNDPLLFGKEIYKVIVQFSSSVSTFDDSGLIVFRLLLYMIFDVCREKKYEKYLLFI